MTDQFAKFPKTIPFIIKNISKNCKFQDWGKFTSVVLLRDGLTAAMVVVFLILMSVASALSTALPFTSVTTDKSQLGWKKQVFFYTFWK